MRLPPFRVLEGDQPGLEASGGVGVEVGAGAQSFDRFGLGIDRENAPAAAKQLERVSTLAAADLDAGVADEVRRAIHGIAVELGVPVAFWRNRDERWARLELAPCRTSNRRRQSLPTSTSFTMSLDYVLARARTCGCGQRQLLWL